MYLRKSGFTLVEIMVASMIGVFVAMVAVGALKAISVSAEMIDNNIESAAEVKFASRKIAADLTNIYRNRNLRNTKLVGTVEETEAGIVSCLTVHTVGRIKARTGEPEGDVYEVEYYLLKDEEKSVLMRRLWPNPDEDTEPGGILSVLAEDIDVFEVRYFDGEDWQVEWPEEMESVPELVEVNIATGQPDSGNAIMESFVVNFARAAGTQVVTTEESESEEEEESDN